MKKLQNMMRYFIMLSVLAGGAFLSSCGGDEEPDPPVAIAFSSSTSSVSENSNSARTVTVNFDGFAPEAGTITIAVSNGTGVESSDYTLSPTASGNSLTLSVASGEQSATFSVTPVDNGDVDGNKEITFTLSAADGGLTLGNTTTTHVLTISDDEVAQTVNFATTNEATVMENSAEGAMVSLALSGAVGQASSITVDVSNNANVTDADYTTDPAVSGGSITLSLEEGAENASFMVMPTDNSDLNTDERTITFTISAADGGLELAGNNLEFALTIEDDEVPVTSIIDIRSLYDPEEDTTFNTKVIIRGIVTSSNDNLTARNFFIQDGTAGIAVRTDGPDNPYIQGDEVEIDLNGISVSEFNDLIQVANIPVEQMAKISEGNALPDPEIATVTDLMNNDFQGRLIQINEVTFLEANGIATLSGNTRIDDGSGTIGMMRVEGYAPFADTPMPIGSGTVIGIASIFNTPQLVPTKASDIFTSNPTAEITLSTETALDFGSVDSGTMSAAQSYTVSATGLTTGITVTAPEAFMVSLTEDGTYESSVTINGDSGSSSVTDQSVFVKFAPTSGTPNSYDGTITHTAANAVAKVLSVSGTEQVAATVFAYTSFEEPATGDRYTDTGDASTDHDLVNNEGEASVDYTMADGELGFDASWVNTRNGEGLTEGDFVGVSSFTGVVGAYTDGVQGYQMGDTDGKMVLKLTDVAVNDFTTVNVFFDLFVQSTGWEIADDNNDLIRIYLQFGDGTTQDILNTTGVDIDEFLVNENSLENTWTTFSASIPSDKQTAVLVFELDSDSGNETIYIDNVKFLGEN